MPKHTMIQAALSVSLTLLLSSAAVAQATSSACAFKRQEIETQINYAQAAGRSHQVAGLEKALAANKAYCTDAKLEQERQEDIQKAERKVAEREQELAEATQKGNSKKIARRKAKLQEAQQALAESQKPLPR